MELITLKGCAQHWRTRLQGSGGGQDPVIQAQWVSLASVTRLFPWRAGHWAVLDAILHPSSILSTDCY